VLLKVLLTQAPTAVRRVSRGRELNVKKTEVTAGGYSVFDGTMADMT